MVNDAAARAAALNTGRSFIVQAPAGSGKTGLLVYRMLSLLATVDQPQRILAITFTRKATAEMRERLLGLMQIAETLAKTTTEPHGHGDHDGRQLEYKQQERKQQGYEQQDYSRLDYEQLGIELARKVLIRDKNKGWNLLDTPHQLQILTIDSFCAKLTASMPWLSRLGDRPRVTDNAEAHYAAAVEQLLAELLESESALSQALQTVMLELDFNYHKARQLFNAMLAKRDQWLRHLLQDDLAALRTRLESTWSDIVRIEINTLNELLPPATTHNLIKLARGAFEILRDADSDKLNPFEAFDAALAPDKIAPDKVTPENLSLSQWTSLTSLLLTSNSKAFRKAVDKRLGFTAGSSEKKQLITYLKEFADDFNLLSALQEVRSLPDPKYHDQDWQQLLSLEQVLKALAALLQLRFRAVGECDHSEVTQRANLALQELDNPTDLGLHMDSHLQHILVDEFQDTSNGQIALLKKLTAGWPAQSSLVENHSAPKTLFLVGDPMQSIYRFREADVSLFLQVADNANTTVFDNITIEPLTLTENFRSSSSLVAWFNRTFKPSFAQYNNVLTGAIRYSEAMSRKAENNDGVEYQLAYNRAQEAALTVTSVQQALSELPDEKAQIAILVRSRSQLTYLLPALQTADISYVGVDIQPLRDQQAVVDVLALCKAICRENDRASWLALLRGPWCGLKLSDIQQLVTGTHQTIWQQLNNMSIQSLTQKPFIRLTRFITIMRATMRQRQQVRLGSLTRWAWRSLGGEHTLFGTSPEDIETVFDLVENMQRGGDLPSINDLDKALDGLFAKPSQGVTDNARIIVSTMHKSKGLQFDTVILPGLSNPPKAEGKAIMMWAEHQNADGDSRLLLAPLRLAAGHTTDQDQDQYSYLRKLDSKRAANEAIRLMYVATTRAERKLILIAHAKPDNETGEIKPPNRNSLLATVWEALQNKFSFTLQFTATNTETNDAEPALPQTLFRLPTDFSVDFAPAIEWQITPQLNTPASSLEKQPQTIEYEWATEVATGVGIVLHDWLQHHAAQVLTIEVDQTLIQRWRTELLALRVPFDRIEYAIKRLSRAIDHIQSDTTAHFLFARYENEQNEFVLSAYEAGTVNQYRLDRTFVDQNGVRWIVDYKSTDTHDTDIERFVDEQVTSRHRTQLEKYGALLSQIDNRPIHLAVYFPLLKQLRTWQYQASDQQKTVTSIMNKNPT